MEFINYIKPELLILPVILYVIGVFLKKSKLKDNFIPIILGTIGVLAAATYCSITCGFTVDVVCVGVVQGFLCASASTNVHQIIKQMKENGDAKAGIAEEVLEYIDGKK